MTTSLYELIEHADAIEIDGHFVRYFSMDYDDVENDDDIVLHVETTDGSCNAWEWFFTVEDLEYASYDPETKDWTVQTNDEDEPYTITIYKVKPIEVIG